MNIVLLGEFSSLHRYLKEGLQELGGYNVKLISNGDDWKKINGFDDVLYHRYKFKPLSIISVLKYPRLIKGNDVVQFINPIIYPLMFNNTNLRIITQNNNCISLVAAGGDYALHKAYEKGLFDYYVYDFSNENELLYGKKSLTSVSIIKSNKYLVKNCDIVIPSLYEYSVGYKDNKKLYSVIPFPINIDSIKYSDNFVDNKLVFFHGLNRELSKGTPYIREALNKLKTNYPKEVEVIIDGRMPFDKYIEVMKRANVVVDQCCTYGYGINACIAMAQGKVVLTGCRKETLQAFGLTEAPMFHAEPNVEQLYSQMQYIVENKKNIPQWGYDSRKYVEDVHDYIKIAQMYLDAWKSTGKA